MIRRLTSLLLLSASAFAVPHKRASQPDPSLASTVVFNNVTFVNKGMVALGVIPHDFKDEFGETLGGVGSAIYIKRDKFDVKTLEGVLVLQPDRGFNVIDPVDWQGRFHTFSFKLKPYYDTADLSYEDAKDTLELEYTKTRLFTDRNGTPVSGADGLASRPATGGDPVFPIHSTIENKLAFDPEGNVQNADGSYWVSDEYGPDIHLFDSTGQRILSINIPDAVLPRIGGQLNFTSSRDPESGRAANQGFEGLTASSDGKTLFAMLQSALMQDGGSSDSKLTNRYTRLFAWDVSSVYSKNKKATAASIKLTQEYVVPLPQSSKGKTRAQSEIYFLNDKQFLVLARDGDGHGSDELSTGYKNVDIFDITLATNIAGLYDGPTGAIAPGGQLINGIVPASYQAFVNLADDTHLARFGLHNGKPADETLINSKWESLALTPAGDKDAPNDYFLFTVSDNDFMTTDGVSMGQPYSYTEDVDTQIFVYRVTLPTVPKGSVEKAISLDD